nr:choice-of-anchor Q domain-containing protein [Thalassococcus arenae]
MLVLRSDTVVERSTIDNNIAHGVNADGAGIAIEFGNFTISDSAITNNITTGADADGGGIASVSINLNIDNTTIAGNQILGKSSFGAGIANGGTIPGRAANLTITNSTFTGNYVADGGGGGIAVYGIGLTTLENNLFVGNAVGFNEFPQFGSGTDVFLFTNNALNGKNVFQQTDVRDLNGDITGVDARDVFAETYEINNTGVFAGVLKDNGGPTKTVALKDDPNNPAIGQSDPATTPDTDQRGVERDDAPDAGAYELDGGPSINVIKGTDARDRLIGTEEADRFEGGAGRDIYLGRGGQDEFVLGNDATDRVRDFEDGVDKLDISAWGVTSLQDVEIVDKNGRAIIKGQNGERANIKFADEGVDFTDLDASDFIFDDGIAAPGLVTIEGTSDRDRLTGTSDNERFVGKEGIDRYLGNGGADQFVLGKDAIDRVLDFQDGVDLLDVSEWGATALSDISIIHRDDRAVLVGQNGERAVVFFDDPVTSSHDLGADDFLFA